MVKFSRTFKGRVIEFNINFFKKNSQLIKICINYCQQYWTMVGYGKPETWKISFSEDVFV